MAPDPFGFLPIALAIRLLSSIAILIAISIYIWRGSGSDRIGSDRIGVAVPADHTASSACTQVDADARGGLLLPLGLWMAERARVAARDGTSAGERQRPNGEEPSTLTRVPPLPPCPHAWPLTRIWPLRPHTHGRPSYPAPPIRPSCPSTVGVLIRPPAQRRPVCNSS